MKYIVYSKHREYTKASPVLKSKKATKAEIREVRKEHPECKVIVAQVSSLYRVSDFPKEDWIKYDV